MHYLCTLGFNVSYLKKCSSRSLYLSIAADDAFFILPLSSEILLGMRFYSISVIYR
jgi:hypothetical protein